MIPILYEDNHLLVVVKPVNVPVQADSTKDDDLLSLLKADLKVRYQKPGNVYLGLVHRLDRPVGGVMVFAKTSKAASRLSDQIRTHAFKKEYQAVVCSSSLKNEDTLIDYLVKDEKRNMVSVTDKDHGKLAELRYHIIKSTEGLSMVGIELKTGRAHQIRVQFASRGAALWGDQRYNASATPGQQIALWATKVSFTHPTTQEALSFTCDVPTSFPWNKF